MVLCLRRVQKTLFLINLLSLNRNVILLSAMHPHCSGVMIAVLIIEL